MDTKLITGTVEMLMLEVVSRGPTYGYEILQKVLAESDGRFDLKEGSLYPALHRLERQALLEATWGEHQGRKRKYYSLTPAGKQELSARRAEWQEFSAGVNGVLGLQPRVAFGL